MKTRQFLAGLTMGAALIAPSGDSPEASPDSHYPPVIASTMVENPFEQKRNTEMLMLFGSLLLTATFIKNPEDIQ